MSNLYTGHIIIQVWYNIKDFFTGWDYMLQASSNFTDSNLYRWVTITTQYK